MVVTYTEWSFKICLSHLYTIVYKLSEAIFCRLWSRKGDWIFSSNLFMIMAELTAQRQRMRILMWMAVLVFAATAGSAQDKPVVVVELFTSQGCSSCPPADALLDRLSSRNNVLALSLHVDYWDYIGWKDKFAGPAHTARQQAYARAAGRRSVYTPQMIINGLDDVAGTAPMDVADMIDRHSRRQPVVELALRQSPNKVRVEVKPLRKIGPSVLQVAYISTHEVVEIKRGENAGRKLQYTNVVKRIDRLRKWSGAGPLTVEIALKQHEQAVLLIQQEGHGAIHSAVLLR